MGTEAGTRDGRLVTVPSGVREPHLSEEDEPSLRLPPHPLHGWDRPRFGLVVFVAVGIAYAIGSLMAWHLFGASVGLAFFPPAGVSLAALTLLRPRWWWVALFAVAVAEVGVDMSQGYGLRISLGYGAANVVEAACGALLLARSAGWPRIPDLRRRRDMTVFALCAIAAGPLVGGVVGATVKVAETDGSVQWLDSVFHWWAGDALGVLAVGAPIVAFATGAARARGGRWEWALYGAALLTVAVLVLELPLDVYPTVLILPVLLWGAFRIGVRGIAAATPVVCIAANAATAAGRGAFAHPEASLATQLSQLQLYLAVLLLSAWFVAIEVDERTQLAAESARERAGQRRLVRRLRAEELASRLAVTSSVADVEEATCRQVRAALGASDVGIVEWDMATRAALQRRGDLRDHHGQAPPAWRDVMPAIEAAARRRGPVHSAVPQRRVHRHATHPSDADVRSVRATPLPGDTSGHPLLLVAAWRGGAASELGDDGELFETFATLLAQARERVQRRNAEHDTAVQLQRALLGEPDHPAGLRVASTYSPADQSLAVGGDWYDVIDLPSGKVVLVIGDVAGHNVSAACSMGRLRSAMRALASVTDDPAALLHRLDDFAAGSGEADFATVFCAVLDLEAGTLTYSNAGHPPALVVAPDGEVVWLDDARSVPIGVARGVLRETQTVAVPAAARVVLYTDGLIERRREHIDAGLGRLEDAVAQLASDPTSGTSASLAASLASTGPQADDVAVLVVELVGDERRWRLPADLARLRTFRHELLDWLGAHRVDRVAATDIALALNEVVANAVEHAYAGRRAGVVDVEVRREAGTVTARVQDHGGWRTPGERDERGRGLVIVRSLCTECDVRTGEDGTLATVTYQLPAEPMASIAGAAAP